MIVCIDVIVELWSVIDCINYVKMSFFIYSYGLGVFLECVWVLCFSFNGKNFLKVDVFFKYVESCIDLKGN